MRQGRAPDFICIGASKAGTTWLYHALAHTPGYWMPPVKELNYFGQPRRNPIQEEWLRERLPYETDAVAKEWIDLFLNAGPRDDDWYKSLFAAAGDRKTGDICPSYARIGPAGIEHARRLAPDAKVLMFVRNPTDRDVSHLIHVATTKRGIHKSAIVSDAFAARPSGVRDFQAQTFSHQVIDDAMEAVGLRITVDELRAAKDSPAFKGSRLQSRALEKWKSVFGEVHAFSYEELRSNPRCLFGRITKALGREAAPQAGFDLEQVANPSPYRIEGLDALRSEIATETVDEAERLKALLN